MGWTGQQSDPNGLTYLRARYYAPGMGRFTQIDPFDGALAVPASMNGYGYAHGSLMMYTDLSGQVVLLTAILIGAAIGGAMGFGFAYGTELYDNWSYVEQEGFWAAQKRLDWGRIWASTAIGAVSGALGGAAGWACWGAHGLLRAGSVFWTANVAWDTATDVGFYGDSLGGALAVNLAFGLVDMPGDSEVRLSRAAMGIGEEVKWVNKSGQPPTYLVRHVDDYAGDDWIRRLVRDRRIEAPQGVKFNLRRV